MQSCRGVALKLPCASAGRRNVDGVRHRLADHPDTRLASLDERDLHAEASVTLDVAPRSIEGIDRPVAFCARPCDAAAFELFFSEEALAAKAAFEKPAH